MSILSKRVTVPVLMLVISMVITGCAGLQLVSPYDEVIYQGLTDYKRELNLHVKNMADLSGTPAGTYESNQLKYNEMETTLELLMDRAGAQATGTNCALTPALSANVDKFLRDDIPPELRGTSTTGDDNSYGCTQILLGKIRLQLDALQEIHRDIDRCDVRSPEAAQAVTIEIGNVGASTSGELDDVVDQAVDEVVESFRENLTTALLAKLDGVLVAPGAEVAADDGGEDVPTVSCLRPATATDALAISNQSINAAWFLENAKKQGTG